MLEYRRFDAGTHKFAIILEPGGNRPGARVFDRAVQKLNFLESISSVTVLLASAISRAWPSSPKPVTSVTHGPPDRAIASAAARFSVSIDSIGLLDVRWRRDAALQRRRDHAGPDFLGQHQHVAGLRAAIGLDRSRMDRTGNRVAELDLGIVHAVPAQDHAAGFPHFRRAALEDCFQIVQVLPEPGQARIESAVSGFPPMA